MARRYGTTIALDEVVTLVIDAEHLRSRCPGNATMGQVLIDLLASEVRAFAAALVEALFVPVEVRGPRRLTALAHLYGHGETGTVIPLTQEGLAGLAGTSRASVSKVLKGLEEASTSRTSPRYWPATGHPTPKPLRPFGPATTLSRYPRSAPDEARPAT